MPNVNLKGFMVDSAHANWNAIRKTYGDGDPNLPMVSCKCICLFH